MIFSIMPIVVRAASSGQCGDNVYWELGYEGTLTISGTGDMYDYDYYSYSPWYNLRANIKTVVMCDGVTGIGNRVFFECRSLTSIIISDTVTSVGNMAFYGCGSMKNITIPSSIISMGDGVFDRCRSLTSITIPNSVTSIGRYAFSGCISLTSVTIPNSITSIYSDAFYNCGNLTDVYYTGSEADWKEISIGSYNDPLSNAKIHYNSSGPEAVSYISGAGAAYLAGGEF